MQLTGESQTIELPSIPESISAVERMIDDIRNKYNVSEDMFGNMLVAITEAVTNAIYHGNNSDPAKKVSISCTHSPGSIVFTIADEGTGFDYYNLPDPTAQKIWKKNVVMNILNETSYRSINFLRGRSRCRDEFQDILVK